MYREKKKEKGKGKEENEMKKRDTKDLFEDRFQQENASD